MCGNQTGYKHWKDSCAQRKGSNQFKGDVLRLQPDVRSPQRQSPRALGRSTSCRRICAPSSTFLPKLVISIFPKLQTSLAEHGLIESSFFQTNFLSWERKRKHLTADWKNLWRCSNTFHLLVHRQVPWHAKTVRFSHMIPTELQMPIASIHVYTYCILWTAIIRTLWIPPFPLQIRLSGNCHHHKKYLEVAAPNRRRTDTEWR